MSRGTVKLSGGEITFGVWTNGDGNQAVRRACSDRELSRITTEKGLQMYVNAMTTNWLLAYSIQRGSGFLKGESVVDTFNNIQKLKIDDAAKLGRAFKEFHDSIMEDVKKKV